MTEKDYEKEKYSPVKVVMGFVSACQHGFDIFTDLNLAYIMYKWSKWAKAHDEKGDYHIAFVMIYLATFGPYIIQYSSLVSSYNFKGLYKKNQFESVSRCK